MNQRPRLATRIALYFRTGYTIVAAPPLSYITTASVVFLVSVQYLGLSIPYVEFVLIGALIGVPVLIFFGHILYPYDVLAQMKRNPYGQIYFTPSQFPFIESQIALLKAHNLPSENLEKQLEQSKEFNKG